MIRFFGSTIAFATMPLPLQQALLIFTLLFVSGCSSLNVLPAGMAKLGGHPQLIPVPLVHQTAQNLCGLAAVDMLTAYYGRPLPAPARAALLAQASTRGIRAADLKQALESAGYFVSVFHGDLGDGYTGLRHHIDAGRPLIAMLPMTDGSHYVVVAGYDDKNRRLYLNDPEGGQFAMRYALFQKLWDERQDFSLLAIPDSGKQLSSVSHQGESR